MKINLTMFVALGVGILLVVAAIAVHNIVATVTLLFISLLFFIYFWLVYCVENNKMPKPENTMGPEDDPDYIVTYHRSQD